MQQLFQVVFIVCCFGFGWAAGSTRLHQDREHGCAAVVAGVAFFAASAGLIWCLVAGSGVWSVWASAITALVVGGLAAALKKRY